MLNSSDNSRFDKVVSALKDILSGWLGIESQAIDIHSNFLELGLESLLLTQFSRSVRDRFGIEIPFRLLMGELSTLEALATYIAQQMPFEEEKSAPSPLPETMPVEAMPVEAISTPVREMAAAQSSNNSQAIAKLIARQLEVMSKQLEVLRSTSSEVKRDRSLSAMNQAQQAIAPTIERKPVMSSQQGDTGLSPHQQRHLDALIARVVKRTQESKKLTQAARPYLANPRSITGFRLPIKEMLYPIHVQRAAGARIWDVDGNEYIDLSMGFGPLLFGHSPPFVVEAIQAQIQQGMQNGPQSRLTGQVTQLFCQLTGQERVTFCNDGTEAVMAAIRIARTATGRSKIAVFAGSYHGNLDEVLVTGVPTANGLRTVPIAPGIPQHMTDKVMVLEYGSPESLQLLKTHAQDLAAVLVEPVQSRRPDFQPQEYLYELRQLTQETGTVLIFDEVITGFRMHPGGIQALWGIQADLSTYGKALGSGLPVGVVAGKAALMDVLDGGFWNYGDASYPQVETTYFAGTFFKNPLVVAGVWAVLNHIKQSGAQLQAELAAKTAKLAATLNAFFEQKQLPIQVAHFGSLFRFIYPPNLTWMNLFFYHLLEKGIYIWEGRTCFLSTAHTDVDIEQAIAAVKESIVEMQAGGFLPCDRQIVPVSRHEHLPLSFAQQRLWFLDRLDPNNFGYNEPIALRIAGELNVAALEQSFNEIIRRHEVLRTTFTTVEGQPVQVIAPHLHLTIPVVDLRHLPSAERETTALHLATEQAQQPFDLTQNPLLRCTLLQLDETEYVLLCTMHHIVTDAWSTGIFFSELAALYAAFIASKPSPLPELPIQYADFAVWQRQQLQGEVLETQLSYWRQQLSGNLPVLQLPTDRPRSQFQTFRGANQSFELPANLHQALRNLSHQANCTLFITLLAAFVTLLHRYTQQDDIVVGTDVANRNQPETEELIGFFVNLLALRINLSGNPGFQELLGRVREVALGAYAHQDLPFERLVDALRCRDRSRPPLCQVLLVMDNVPTMPALELPGLTLSPIDIDNGTAKFDLVLFVEEKERGIVGKWQYNTDLFDAATINRMSKHFETLLQSIVAQPEARIDSLEMQTQAEIARQAEKKSQQKAAKRQKFVAVQPKVVDLSQNSAIATDLLQPGATLPLVITPTVDDFDRIDWAKSDRQFIETKLLHHGAILFRNFKIASASEFESFAEAICPGLFGEYGDLPREGVSGKVYGSTPYPSEQAILFHNESSHLHCYPQKIWFFCMQPAAQGGETPIVDSRKVYQLLDPKLRQKFAQKQLMYVRNFTDNLDVSWQDFFHTNDRAAVEAYCRKAGMSVEWKPDGSLRTCQVRPAVINHPQTGETVFFNQIQLHHPSYLQADVRESLMSVFGAENLPRQLYYGDRSPIEASVIEEVLAVYKAAEISFPWQQGDVLMLDNILAAHGRNPYIGSRKIVVAMGEMIHRADIENKETAYAH
ncbi:hypothetical protein C7Y66_09370 [Chroococcidiopsis sp. CCALA 051]|uniref:aminotransferase class III-fold pyridoxal phosphate-dependent enzyme n=1 Tax=Chroococcidiopsis sp. CCALA 051 TaxID=869949 RepID=UPI000D0DD315|nr:aminotransferase class III-fold pyridoxal phosphate-dependent enzyme [Chroococcidiopsis sp. CCALA 051]PSM49383.1 hypothetical protein C7Y66_09370 [Chroococcidiopsis sp. CCALA 051]